MGSNNYLLGRAWEEQWVQNLLSSTSLPWFVHLKFTLAKTKHIVQQSIYLVIIYFIIIIYDLVHYFIIATKGNHNLS